MVHCTAQRTGRSPKDGDWKAETLFDKDDHCLLGTHCCELRGAFTEIWDSLGPVHYWKLLELQPKRRFDCFLGKNRWTRQYRSDRDRHFLECISQRVHHFWTRNTVQKAQSETLCANYKTTQTIFLLWPVLMRSISRTGSRRNSGREKHQAEPAAHLSCCDDGKYSKVGLSWTEDNSLRAMAVLIMRGQSPYTRRPNRTGVVISCYAQNWKPVRASCVTASSVAWSRDACCRRRTELAVTQRFKCTDSVKHHQNSSYVAN
jgi:hypothetical protein